MTLREFQSTLTGKVLRASASATPASLLGFEAGDEFWLVDLGDAGEVLPVPPLADVPLTRPWFRGIANVRGTLFGVTDLAAFHGHGPTPIRAQSRLLLAGPHLGTAGANIALLMTATQGMKSMATLEATTASADLGPARPWRGECWRDGDGRVWSRLSLPTLFAAPEFLDIAASQPNHGAAGPSQGQR